MLCWDPRLIICFCTCCHSWAISTDDRDLLCRVDFLRAASRPLCALTTFASTTLLREQSGDPCLVDEEDGSAEGCCQEEVKEQTVESQYTKSHNACGPPLTSEDQRS